MNKSIKPFIYSAIHAKLVRFKGMVGLAFTVIVGSENYTIGIAEKGTTGYTPTGIVIDELQYADAKDIVDALNEDILGLDLREAAKIVLETMRQTKAGC